MRGLEEEVCWSREHHGSLEERLHANKDDQVDLLLASTCSSVMIALPRLAAPCRGCRDAGGVRCRPSWRTHSPVNSCLTTSIQSTFCKVAVFLSTLPGKVKTDPYVCFLRQDIVTRGSHTRHIKRLPSRSHPSRRDKFS